MIISTVCLFGMLFVIVYELDQIRQLLQIERLGESAEALEPK